MIKQDIITIYKDNVLTEYKLLLIIQKEYNYIIYTDMDNMNPNKDLYVAKVKSIDNLEETLSISEEEWKMIEAEYQRILRNSRD